MQADPVKRHQERIAKDTVRNPAKALLGGPSVDEAKSILRKLGWTDAKIRQLEQS
jgi:hypothetical protein